ncbi:MAG TPA: hypothetical protein VF789_24625 [Thermoanaerobaculia bacterium]
MKKLAILSLTCLALVGPAAPQTPSSKVQGTVIIKAISDEKAETESELELKKMNEAGQRISARMGEARKGGPLAELAALQTMEAEYADNEHALSYIRTTVAQLLLPRMGDYAGAHRYADLLADKSRAPEPPSPLESYTPVNALQAIAEAAGTRKVVMINEAHHVPQHRAFTIELLSALRKQGFTYFAAETLQEDPGLAERGYPTGMTGAYIQEPLYGDLVRTALRLGYKVVPYESESFDRDPQVRENEQARHLVERILNKDPKARVVVHAGYGHISEEPSPAGIPKMMAVVFKEMTGIDPLTINQYWMTEHSAPEYENPTYRWAVESGLIGEPVVFRKADGKLWTRGRGFDVTLFHPRSRYENGRPHWLRMGGLRSPYPLLQEICGQVPRCLVKARPVEEGEDAIPIDQVMVDTDKPAPTLMLPAGKFVIRVEDAARKAILEFPATVGSSK